jgi:hypothetical protein
MPICAKMVTERIEKRLILKKSLSVNVENRDVVYLGWLIVSTYFERKRQIAKGAISLCSRSPYCRLNMELVLQSLFGLHVRSSLAETPQPPPPPSPRIWAHRRGRYWSAKIDKISKISLWPPDGTSTNFDDLTLYVCKIYVGSHPTMIRISCPFGRLVVLTCAIKSPELSKILT